MKGHQGNVYSTSALGICLLAIDHPVICPLAVGVPCLWGVTGTRSEQVPGSVDFPPLSDVQLQRLFSCPSLICELTCETAEAHRNEKYMNP